MNADLEKITLQLEQACSPQDVFGKIEAHEDLPALKLKYHALAKIVHPDLYGNAEDKALANIAFELLNEWFRQAKERAKFGTCEHAGGEAGQMILQTRQHVYTIDSTPAQGEVFNTYPCRYEEHRKSRRAVLKIVRDPHQNEFSQNEALALGRLGAAPGRERFAAYFPRLIESFLYQDGSGEHQACVFTRYSGWYTLEAVRRAYPRGIDPRDVAWMFRRLLVALGFAHRNGIIHGGLGPSNIWILPAEHGLMLMDWSRSSLDHIDLAAGARLEIGQAVRAMIFISGGDPQNGILPGEVPAAIKAFFKGSLLPGKRAPQDAWALKEEFDELIGRLWGPRKFHPFVM